MIASRSVLPQAVGEQDPVGAAGLDLVRVELDAGSELLRVLMNDAVQRDRDFREHDRWFRGEIDHALGEADDPSTPRLAHESVRSRWQQHAAIERQATGLPT